MKFTAKSFRRLGIGIALGFAAYVGVLSTPGATLLLLIFAMLGWPVLAAIVVVLVLAAVLAQKWKLVGEMVVGTTAAHSSNLLRGQVEGVLPGPPR